MSVLNHVQLRQCLATGFAFLVVCTSGFAFAEAKISGLTQNQAQQIVAPFYEMLNKPATRDLKALAEEAIAQDWRSYTDETHFKTREELISLLSGFGRVIPDLTWEVKDVLVDGSRIVVRSEASGTPENLFLGVPVSGKRFQIMTIDIHTVQNGKLVTTHHIEDWASAIRQLSSK